MLPLTPINLRFTMPCSLTKRSFLFAGLTRLFKALVPLLLTGRCLRGAQAKHKGLLSPIEDGLLLLLFGARAAQYSFPGFRVLRFPLRQGFHGEGRSAGGVGIAEHAVGRRPLQDADLGGRTRRKAVVLNHNRHFRRRF